MRTLSKYLCESGSSFSDNVKYSKSDFKKWSNAAKDLYSIARYGEKGEKDYNLILIYKNLSKKDEYGCDIEHIATYDMNTEILSTNDTTIFGH